MYVCVHVHCRNVRERGVDKYSLRDIFPLVYRRNLVHCGIIFLSYIIGEL